MPAIPNQVIETQKVPGGFEVYAALMRVAAKVDIILKEKNPRLGYAIAGAQQVMAAVRPHLIEQQVLMFPVKTEIIKLDEFTTAKGSVMNRAVLKVDWRFVHIPTGNYFDVPMEGEGQDIGDKSIQKARTTSQKYALRQTLMLEFGDADPDYTPSEEQERASKTSAKTNTKKEEVETGEMASEEAWRYWEGLTERANELKIEYPTLTYPILLSKLKKVYADINVMVKAKTPKEEA